MAEPTWEVLPPEAPRGTGGPLPPPEEPRKADGAVPPPGHGERLVAAFAIAIVSDALSLGLTFAPPLQWTLDIATALALFVVLGRQWLLLPALVTEAIPGLAVLPAWVLVVASIAAWGRVNPIGGPRA
jgi:hypothetical protein